MKSVIVSVGFMEEIKEALEALEMSGNDIEQDMAQGLIDRIEAVLE